MTDKKDIIIEHIESKSLELEKPFDFIIVSLCKDCHLEKLKELNASTSTLFPIFIVIRGLHEACLAGQTHVAEWLCRTFDVKPDVVKIFHKVCSKGHLSTAKLIHSICHDITCQPKGFPLHALGIVRSHFATSSFPQ